MKARAPLLVARRGPGRCLLATVTGAPKRTFWAPVNSERLQRLKVREEGSAIGDRAGPHEGAGVRTTTVSTNDVLTWQLLAQAGGHRDMSER